MKAIQKELGELEDAPNELEELEKKIQKAGMPKEARDKAMAEFNKLKLMSPMSAEATVVRNYIDWLVNVPWKSARASVTTWKAPRRYSLPTTTAWIRSRSASLNTLPFNSASTSSRARYSAWSARRALARPSLGQSIARATNRKFTRMFAGRCTRRG